MADAHEGRLRCLPSIGLLILINLIPLAASPSRSVVVPLMILSLIYTAWLVLRIRDACGDCHSLGGIELWLFRFSGLISILILFTTFLASSFAADEPWSPETHAIFMQIFMELGVFFSTACLLAPVAIRPLPPVFAWKAINLPLWIIYVLLLTLGTMANALRGYEAGW